MFSNGGSGEQLSLGSPKTRTKPPTAAGNAATGRAAERPSQWRGAYTVMPPNELKRQQISKMAQEEAAAYEKFKQPQKVAHVSYVGTAGGHVSETTSRATARGKHLENNPVQRKLAAEQRRTQVKRQDEMENDRHKTVQREKALSNEKAEAARELALNADRRRKNESFLRKFEAR